jgi:hypothetical protein
MHMNLLASPTKPSGARERSLDGVQGGVFAPRRAAHAQGHHMGRTPGEPSDHFTATIVEWPRGQLAWQSGRALKAPRVWLSYDTES